MFTPTLTNSKKYRRAVGMLGLFLVAVVLFGCGSKAADADDKDAVVRKKKVYVHTVTTREMVDMRSYTADLEASTEITLYPLVAERIVSFPVEEGDQVQVGQVIVKIRAAAFKKNIAQMNAEIESLDQNLNSMKRELDRSTSLYNKAVITEQTLDQMDSNYKATLAKRKSLEASLGQIEITAGNAVLKSPVDGFVVGKQLEEGDIAQPAIPLCRVVNVDPIRVELGIIEKDLMAVRKGMPVELTVSAIPDHVFRGEIVRIMPILDKATRTNEARIEIANPVDEAFGAPLLKPGMFGRVSIIVERKPSVVVVPSQALMVGATASADERRIFVVDQQNVVQRRTVRVGIKNGDWVEVTEGLGAGDRVVTRGQYSLKSGDEITVVIGELEQETKTKTTPDKKKAQKVAPAPQTEQNTEEKTEDTTNEETAKDEKGADAGGNL